MGGEVLVVDDNVRIQLALTRVVRGCGSLACVPGSYVAATEAITTMTSRPEAAIVDVHLDHGTSGNDIIGMINAKFCDRVPIVVMSGYFRTDLTKTVNIGPNVRFLPKPLEYAVLREFLRSAAALHPLRHDSPMRPFVEGLVQRNDLSAREARIVGGLAAGWARRDLSDHLQTSENTLKSQIRNLLAKLNFKSIDEVVQTLLRATNQPIGPD